MRKAGIAAEAAVDLQFGRVMSDSTFHQQSSWKLSCFCPSTHQTGNKPESTSEGQRLNVPDVVLS